MVLRLTLLASEAEADHGPEIADEDRDHLFPSTDSSEAAGPSAAHYSTPYEESPHPMG